MNARHDGWDPAHYLSFAGQRGRPFLDLVARVDVAAPRSVVDLGCGAGNLTVLLARRWPGARVLGLDSSPAMVAAAPAGAGVEFRVGDLRDWLAGAPRCEVVVSNAVLQWVPGHLDLLPALVGAVAPGGRLAFQVPGNFGQPTHTIRAELAAEAAYADHTAGAVSPHAHDAATYLHALRGLGCEVDAWETTYLHVLAGADAVFTWVRATGARPTLDALPPGLREEFEVELRARLRAAYPERDGVVVLPFRRIFVVARVGGPP